MKEFNPICCWINTHWCTNILLENHVTNSEKTFIYGERHSIDKSLFSELSTSSSLRRPIGRCFRKVSAFSDLRFEKEIYNF